jgi:hypothetical protein
MIYQLESERRFPCRVRIGARAVGWVEAEVQNWLAGRIAHHRAGEQRNASLTFAPGKSAAENTGSPRPGKASNQQLVDSQLFLFAANRNCGHPVK